MRAKHSSCGAATIPRRAAAGPLLATLALRAKAGVPTGAVETPAADEERPSAHALGGLLLSRPLRHSRRECRF